MKTNVTLISEDRNLFGTIIKQQTKTGMLSVKDLQEAYNYARFQYGWSDKRISDILNNKSSIERIYHILNERELVKTTFPAFMEMVEKEGITKVLKGLKVYKTTGRGENRSTYADPYIWVLIALELNPKIYAKVVMWLTDKLIFDRIEAGTYYKPMNSAIATIVKNPKYHVYAKEMNISVFGQHQTGIRNLASSKELEQLSEIERFIISAIKMKFIDDENGILLAIKNYFN